MSGPGRGPGGRGPGGLGPGSHGAGGRVPGDPPEDRRTRDGDPDEKPRGMERLSDLLPGAAREFGLEDQLEQARVASAWLAIVADLIPAAAGSCRLVGLDQGVATIEADEPIVAQELRLRSLELLAALRNRARTPVRQLRVTTRHV